MYISKRSLNASVFQSFYRAHTILDREYAVLKLVNIYEFHNNQNVLMTDRAKIDGHSTRQIDEPK